MKRATVFFLGTFLFAVFSSPVKADDVIRIGIIANTFGYAPVFVGKEKGFFKPAELVVRASTAGQ
jgi:ABC-type nitrate/sulfonate/bicarbonate transport system substrate-binding protein